MKAQLCLGTAQFGSNYGITNQFGKPSNEEIDLILENALNYNISFFDTANSYGNSESLIGNKLKNKSLKFITKFSSGIKDSYTDKSITPLEENFKETLKNLKRNNIDSYLLHNSNDLKKVNSQLLLEWLNQLKSQGRIKRIGISIYEESDLEGIPLEEIDVVQMPISIYDQRLLRDSFIKKLLKYDISIHIRSIFLQGLLLQEAIKWPNYINKSFLSHHNLYESEVRSRKLSLMDRMKRI